MTDGADDDRQALVGALEAIHRTYEAEEAAIRAIASPQAAFELATLLRNDLSNLVTRAGELRAQMVRLVWESEQMSLSALAQRIGVSKARADQLIRATDKEDRKP